MPQKTAKRGARTTSSARHWASGALRTLEIRVSASTANLGAGFDCFGLALKLYLTVQATLLPGADSAWQIRSRGEPGSESLPSTAEENLIARAMRTAAERHGLELPPLRLDVHNGIPLASGLGSSAAALVAGVKLCSALNGNAISDDATLSLAAELEGHADNVAAALYGGFVITVTDSDRRVLAHCQRWPAEIRVLVVTPHVKLETQHARAVLPPSVSRADAVHNLQRAALFCAALGRKRHDLFWKAMQDRLHQPYRGPLIPGLAEALATPRLPGMLGIALSGAGPSVVALAKNNRCQIGEAIAAHFHKRGIETTVRQVATCPHGAQVFEHTPARGRMPQKAKR